MPAAPRHNAAASSHAGLTARRKRAPSAELTSELPSELQSLVMARSRRGMVTAALPFWSLIPAPKWSEDPHHHDQY
jgi:hypothetical protein